MFNRKGTRDVLIVSMTATAVVVGMLTTQYAGYQLGFSTARNLVENSSLGNILRTPIQTAADVRALFGTVTAVNGTSITLHIASINPFDTPSLNDRVVLVASSTKITKLVSKDLEVFQNELEAYTKTMESESPSKTQLTPPAPVTHMVSTLAEIKVDDVLMVTAATNIKSMKEFTASEINIQPSVTSSSGP